MTAAGQNQGAKALNEKLIAAALSGFYKLVNSWPTSLCLHLCTFALLSIRRCVFLWNHMGQRLVSTQTCLPNSTPMIPLSDGRLSQPPPLSFPSPFKTSCPLLASRPINLSTPEPQRQMFCSNLKATFIIILASYIDKAYSR